MDKIDRAILSHLQKDGRMSNTQLASAVGLSESACLRRVKKLVDDGVITHFSAQINAARVGLGSSVFVRVSLERQTEDQLRLFETAVKKVPEVMECFLMGGDVDYLMRIAVKDTSDYERVHHVLTNLPGVMRVHSGFALRTVLKRPRLPL